VVTLVAEVEASTVVEGDSPEAAMVAATAEVDTTVEATVAAITVAPAEAGLTPDQARMVVAAPTEACAAALPQCAAPTTLGLQRATELVIVRRDGIPSNSLPTMAQCPHALVRHQLAGLGQKPVQATTRRRPTRLLPTDNGTASALGTRARLWLQTVPA
jgi:hypothetical protein